MGSLHGLWELVVVVVVVLVLEAVSLLAMVWKGGHSFPARGFYYYYYYIIFSADQLAHTDSTF